MPEHLAGAAFHERSISTIPNEHGRFDVRIMPDDPMRRQAEA
jgi:hypothetical protein